jgi:hypothetical protein
MRVPKPHLVAAGAAICLALAFCASSEACGRRRICFVKITPVCSSPPSATDIPYWVRRNCTKDGYAAACAATPDFPYCWCCQGGHWVYGVCPQCPVGSTACTASSTVPPSVNCPRADGECCASGANSNCIYLMICDCCTHRMRFAYPWEKGDGYFPLWCLHKPC